MTAEFKILLATTDDGIKHSVTTAVSVSETIPAGYMLDMVSDGLEVLDKIKKTNYNIIFLDTTLPAFNGVILLKIINKIRPQIKIWMLVTGTIWSSQQDIINQTIQSGASGYIFKPISVETIAQTIKTIYDYSRIQPNKKVVPLEKVLR